jgi:hypothetical protein
MAAVLQGMKAELACTYKERKEIYELSSLLPKILYNKQMNNIVSEFEYTPFYF